MGYLQNLTVRSYNMQIDRDRVEDLERRCEVGPAERVVLFTNTLGDPICRIRNSPMYNMLVAEKGKELVGVVQGTIKLATIHELFHKNLAKVGYVLGLRVAPLHRREGIALMLVQKLEEWFIENDVDYAYMATEKDNKASVNLFINKLGYNKFMTPSILVNPVNCHTWRVSSHAEIRKIKIEEAEVLYRKFITLTEFFPNDISSILRNKLSLGTWVAYPRGERWDNFGSDLKAPTSWAMLSVWNSGEVFKLRLGKAPLSCFICTKSSRLIDKIFPCFRLPTIPDFFRPFGFYFMYGLYHEGPMSGKLVKTLCQFVHNLATKSKDCKAIVTEVGGSDPLRVHIPYWESLSCLDDLWCIKALKSDEEKINGSLDHELTKALPPPPTTRRALFVDPREV